MRRALLIVNCNSRTGEEALATIERGLRQIGVEPLHHECRTREELSPLIVKHGSNADLVVVGGGDGTLNAAAHGLRTIDRPLGIIPTGTANDLARTLGIPADIDAAIRLLANAELKSIDLGYVNDQPFFNVASIGMSADLARELTSDLKRRFGKLGYAIAALRVLSKAKPFRAEIASEERRIKAVTLQIAIGNGRYYGGGNVIEESAAIDDGTLDLYSLEFLKTWQLILMLRSFRRGKHNAWNDVRVLNGSRFEVRTRRPKPVNADGEIITHTPAVFGLVRNGIRVFVPKGS